MKSYMCLVFCVLKSKFRASRKNSKKHLNALEHVVCLFSFIINQICFCFYSFSSTFFTSSSGSSNGFNYLDTVAFFIGRFVTTVHCMFSVSTFRYSILTASNQIGAPNQYDGTYEQVSLLLFQSYTGHFII